MVFLNKESNENLAQISEKQKSESFISIKGTLEKEQVKTNVSKEPKSSTTLEYDNFSEQIKEVQAIEEAFKKYNILKKEVCSELDKFGGESLVDYRDPIYKDSVLINNTIEYLERMLKKLILQSITPLERLTNYLEKYKDTPKLTSGRVRFLMGHLNICIQQNVFAFLSTYPESVKESKDVKRLRNQYFTLSHVLIQIPTTHANLVAGVGLLKILAENSFLSDDELLFLNSHYSFIQDRQRETSSLIFNQRSNSDKVKIILEDIKWRELYSKDIIDEMNFW